MKPKKKRRKIPVAFTFPQEDVEWLEEEAERSKRAKNAILMIAMELYRNAQAKSRTQ